MTQPRSLRRPVHIRFVSLVSILAVSLPVAVLSGGAPAAATTVSTVGGMSDPTSVSCTSEPFCLVGGFDRPTTTDPSATPEVATATNGTVGATMAVPGLYDVLGVACESATVCLAVGAIRTGSGTTGGVAQITDGKVGSATAVAGTTGLRAVACPVQSASCVAVGDSSSSGSAAVVPIEDDRVGAAQTVSGASNLTGVGCMDTSHCVAVGGLNQDVNTHYAVVVPITSGVAGGVQSVSAASVFFGVGCAGGTTTCLAVGALETSQEENGSVGVVEPISSGHATGTGTVGGTNALYGAACADSSHCFAVGNVHTGSSSEHAGVVVPVSGGTSGAVEQVAGTFDLMAVSCQSTDTCVAAGYDRSSANPAVDTGQVVLIGGGGAVQGPFFSKEKRDAQADLGPALQNAITYCTPTALGLVGFGTGILLTGVGGPIAVAGVLTAYATAPFCKAVLTRVVNDYRRYKDPPDSSYSQLANPASIPAVDMPSCSRFSGSDLQFCTELSGAEKDWVQAAETLASIGQALSATMDREHAASAAGDRSAVTLQDTHLSALQSQAQAALASVASTGKAVAHLLSAHGVGYRLSRDQSGAVIDAVQNALAQQGASATALASAAGGSPFEPRAINVLDALAGGTTRIASSGSSFPVIGYVLIVLAAVALAAGGGFWVRRRRKEAVV